MRILFFNNEQYQANKIIKTDKDIIGQDANGNEVFAFRGISDFSYFVLEDGQTFDILEPTTEEKLSATQKELDEAQLLLIETRASLETVSGDFQNFIMMAYEKMPNIFQ